jgi:hypothetical protein
MSSCNTAIESYLKRIPQEWGWFVSSPETAASMERELLAELCEGHLLKDRTVKIIANRHGTDDVLCWHVNEPDRFTVIHLTWSGAEEVNDHPWVEADGSFDDFLAYEQRFHERH